MYSPVNGNVSSANRNRKERKVSILFRRSNEEKHCAGIESLALIPESRKLFTASRDSVIRRWDISQRSPKWEATYVGHTDWVTDIVLVGDLLISSSNDGSVRYWKADSAGTCVRVQHNHCDYVTCLAAAPAINSVASGGLTSEIFLSDITTGRVVQLYPGQPGGPAGEQHGSVYALAMNPAGTLLAAGTSENCIRLLDPRTGNKVTKLRGHTDNVRCVVVNSEGSTVLSGSSDGSIKLWDVGMARCVQTYNVHVDSVWHLAAAHDFSYVLSAGRDKAVYRTDIHTRTSEFLVQEHHPIRSMVLDPTDHSLWCATPSSSCHKWQLPPAGAATASSTAPRSRAFYLRGGSMRPSLDVSRPRDPMAGAPAATIQGLPSIISHRVLPDRQRILAKDSTGNLAVWSVLTGDVCQQMGSARDMDSAEKELWQPIHTPSWFSCDHKLGRLCITLEPSSCFSAEQYAAALLDDPLAAGVGDDYKVPLAKLVLEAAFARWKAHLLAVQHGAPLPHDPPEEVDRLWCSYWKNVKPIVMIEDTNGRKWPSTMDALSAEWSEPEYVPPWVGDAVLRNAVVLPKESKTAFVLMPVEGSGLPALLQSKLNAPKILQVHKVAHYCASKLMDDGVQADVRPVYLTRPKYAPPDPTGPEVAKRPVLELTCNGVAVPYEMSLASVKKFIWKKPEDLVFHYRIQDPQHPAPLPKLAMAN